MGVVNVTPDSFSDGGRYADPARAIARSLELVRAGAMVIDVGGESTRPGAEPVGDAVEIDRIAPVIAALAGSGCIVSIDTSHVAVAEAAIAAGAHIVNDVSGLRDRAMVELCASTGTPAVIMHMLGTPAAMQREPTYVDVVDDVCAYLAHAAAGALDAGVPSVMVDPGIGFGKTVAHNLALLRAVPFGMTAPVLVGASRKRFIEHVAGASEAGDRDPGSIAVHLFAAQRGAAMVRVHDVAGHVQALALDRAVRAGAPADDPRA